MEKDIKIFIVDKDEKSSVIIEHFLKEIKYNYEIKIAESLKETETFVDDTNLNIFIVDVSENTDNAVFDIDKFEKKHKNSRFILSSYGLKSDYIVRFLRNSKKDFIDKPIIKNNLIKILNEIIEKKTSEQDFSGQGKIITVFSNKGGLGKTTIAVNLAMELANKDKNSNVAIVDINMFLGDVTTFLDTNPPYDLQYITEKVKNTENIKNLPAQYGNTNLYIIADSPYRDFSNTIDRNSIVKLFNVLRKNYQYIIIDGTSAITGRMKVLFDFSDMILLISESNLPTLRNCKKCLDLFTRINVLDKTELILNRYSFDDECTLEDVENVLQKSVYMVIPNDWQSVTDSINRGLTIGETYPDTAVYESFSELAEMVADKLCH